MKFISLLLSFILIVFTVVAVSGCYSNTQTSQKIENVLDSALSVAVNILSSQGTQQLAISAAQSYISSVITDKEQLAILNKIVEDAVPQLSEDLTNLIKQSPLPKALSAKEKAQQFSAIYKSSNDYKNIVKRCVLKYN